MKVAIGGLLQESNTFSPVATRREHFQLAAPDQLIALHSDGNSELHGFIDVLSDSGVEMLPLPSGWAVSQGRVVREDALSLVHDVLTTLRTSDPVDGVLLALHGAWAAEGIDSLDGYLVQQVRQLVGVDVPIIITLDLHACISRQLSQFSDALVGYKTCPHVDLYETGAQAARMMISVARGKARPAMAVAKLPMVVQAENMISDRGEFRELLDHVHSLEQRPGVLSASLFAVQPWLDVEDLGWAAVVIADGDRQIASTCALELAEHIWSLRHAFIVPVPSVEEAFDQALAVDGGPVVLAEGADGTMGGAPGDSTAILAAILDRQMDLPTAAYVVDPHVVEEAIHAGVGSVIDTEVGGRLNPAYARSVRFRGKVKLISDGEFRYKGRAYTGRVVQMGRSVVLTSGRIALLVSERAAPTTDPELYRSHGIEPTEMKFVLVKSPLGARLEYEPISRAFIGVNSAGCCTPDLLTLPFQRMPRPIFPFDSFAFSPSVDMNREAAGGL